MERASHRVTMRSKHRCKLCYDFNRVVMELRRVIEASRSCTRLRRRIHYLRNDTYKREALHDDVKWGFLRQSEKSVFHAYVTIEANRKMNYDVWKGTLPNHMQ